MSIKHKRGIQKNMERTKRNKKVIGANPISTLTIDWISPEQAHAINQKLNRDCYPVFVSDNRAYYRAFMDLFDEYVSTLRRKGYTNIAQRTSAHYTKQGKQVIHYVTGCPRKDFWNGIAQEFYPRIAEAIKNRPQDGFYIIRPDLTLWDIRQTPASALDTVCSTEIRTAPEKEETETKPAEEKPEARKKPLVTWKSREERLANLKPREKKSRPMHRSRDFRNFEKLMKHFGQSFDALLLPAPQNIMESLLQQEQQKLEQKRQRIEQQKAEKEAIVKKKNTERVKAYRSKKQKEWLDYLASLTPKEAEKAEEEKKALEKERRQKYQQNRKNKEAAKLASMSEEEQEKYLSEKQAKEEEAKEKHRKKVLQNYHKNKGTTKRDLMTEEEKAAWNAESRKKYREKLDNMSEEERRAYYDHRNELKRQARARRKEAMTEQQIQAEKDKEAKRVAEQRKEEQERIASLPEEERIAAEKTRKEIQNKYKRDSRARAKEEEMQR